MIADVTAVPKPLIWIEYIYAFITAKTYWLVPKGNNTTTKVVVFVVTEDSLSNERIASLTGHGHTPVKDEELEHGPHDKRPLACKTRTRTRTRTSSLPSLVETSSIPWMCTSTEREPVAELQRKVPISWRSNTATESQRSPGLRLQRVKLIRGLLRTFDSINQVTDGVTLIVLL